MNTSRYRPEIDGLRAVAVLSVLLYHSGFSFVPGGFIGVDVFFVISGYLITRLLVDEINETRRLRFWDFYARRVRRIVPALAATAMASLTVGAALFPPEMLVRLSQTVVAALFSVSNILFWRESGYFDAANITKPLLHTWSLGVEEQFYLIWPALLLVASKLRAPLFWVVAGLSAASLGLSILFIEQQSAIYYLLPFRAFELGLGACVLWIERFRGPKALCEAASLFGLALIAGSAILFNQQITFPSYNALWPCLGAAMVIYAGPTASSFLVRNRVTVGIGLISYSLYLVHWPLIVFYRYWRNAPPSDFEKVGLCLAAIILAGLFYLFIEQPFRRKSNVIGRHAIIATAAVSLIIASGAATAWLSAGWLWRYPPKVAALIKEPPRATHSSCILLPRLTLTDIPERCYKITDTKKPSVILVGDSTADDLYPGLASALHNSAYVYSWATSSCPPVYDSEAPQTSNCARANAKFFGEILEQNHYDLVVFSCNRCWSELKSGFPRTAAFMDARGIPFVLLGQRMSYTDKPINLAAQYARLEGLPEAIADKKASSCSDEINLDKLAPGRFFSMKQIFCRNGTPFAIADGQMLNVDTLHYSLAGSDYAALRLVAWLKANGHMPVRNHQTN